MVCCLNELKSKEVIDINTGVRLGCVDDVRFDTDTSEVFALLIYGRYRLFGLLGREKDTEIPCSAIRVVGEEVVLINADQTMCTKSRRKIWTGLFE